MKLVRAKIAVILFSMSSIVSAAIAGPVYEVAFSPREGAENLVIKVIDSAKFKVRLAAYSLTSPQIVGALINARKRGVDVQVVADFKMNLKSDSRAGRVALGLLAENGVRTRVIQKYEIHHDKYIITDDMNVETGSFNYSKAAEFYNSENVLVVWDNQELASKYLRHWQSRFDDGLDFKAEY